MRKNFLIMFYIISSTLLIAGCQTDFEGKRLSTTNMETKQVPTPESEVEAQRPSKQELETKEESAQKPSEQKLSGYAAEEIEYARVWLQLGANQAIDELNVNHIQKGALVNPELPHGARYPESVVQLSGSRLVDGSVTYHSNGNGTVTLYQVPLRWDAPSDTGTDVLEQETKKIIHQPKVVTIAIGQDDEVKRLIGLLTPSSTH
ncbi:hypothetical protein QUF51_17890 [Bacillus pumilus]|nr:hypothetical protein [Bacillus pumilus]